MKKIFILLACVSALAACENFGMKERGARSSGLSERMGDTGSPSRTGSAGDSGASTQTGSAAGDAASGTQSGSSAGGTTGGGTSGGAGSESSGQR